MSLFSTVTVAAEEECENCRSSIRRRVQFKYGDTRLREYHVGDQLLWGGNDVGRPGLRLVRVSGHPEPCPVCKYHSDDLYEVRIERDRIVEVRRVGRADQEVALFGETGRREEE